MVNRDAVGGRLKRIRNGKSLSLKALEAQAGISATHISEIERGLTSPTIGVLSRIAQALRRDVSYFLEDEALEEVCHLGAEDESFEPLPWGGGRLRRLTRLIPGARLSAYEIVLEPDGAPSEEHVHEGNEVYLVEEGQLRFTVDGQDFDVNGGDSIHIQSSRPHSYRNVGKQTARMRLFTTRRHML